MTQQNQPDINSVSKEELMAVPELNSQLADRIIENRPFQNPKDLDCLFLENDPRLDELRARFRFPEAPADEQTRPDAAHELPNPREDAPAADAPVSPHDEGEAMYE